MVDSAKSQGVSEVERRFFITQSLETGRPVSQEDVAFAVSSINEQVRKRSLGALVECRNMAVALGNLRFHNPKFSFEPNHQLGRDLRILRDKAIPILELERRHVPDTDQAEHNLHVVNSSLGQLIRGATPKNKTSSRELGKAPGSHRVHLK